ncbi:hypothetical protein D3C71_1547380 [compost metagenome]
MDDLGIDQLDQSMLLIGVHHDQPFQDADLRSGQSDALCVIHRIRHIIQQLLDVGGNFRHRLRRFMKDFIRLFND